MAARVADLSDFVWCLLLIISSFCKTSSSDRTLKITHVLFRHGNRSPLQAYPSDRYQEDSWPQGFGQLTQEGMRQHYELGQWLRKRYVTDHKLLNSSYARTEIHIRSTAYDRTLMSAESNLAGLYPPEGRQKWNQQLAWQPIPVFTKPKTDDALLAIGHTDCPRWKEHQAKLRTLHREYIDKNKEFFNSVAKLGGFDTNNATYRNFSHMADTIYFERADGRKLPDWATEDLLSRLLPVLDVSYAVEAQLDNEYFKLCSGLLLQEIITHLKDKTAGTETVKMYMYSGHDDNVGWLLRSLNVFNNRSPPPASCVLIELYQEDDKSYTVDVLFRNDSKKEPHKLKMPGTSDGHCTLDHFYKITEHLLLSDVTMACKVQHTHDEGRLLPETWNTGSFRFQTRKRALEWLLVLVVLIIILLFISLRKWGKILRNLNTNLKLRVLSSSVTDV